MKLAARSRIALAGTLFAGIALALTGQGVAYAGTTSGNGGVANGSQISLPVSVPVDICGNAVAALGLGRAQCPGGAATGTTGTTGTASSASSATSSSASSASSAASTTTGSGSIGSGNQISIPVTIPIDVCGNSLAVLGSATGNCQAPVRSRGIAIPRHTPKPPKRPKRPKRPKLVPLTKPTAPETGVLPITGVNLAGMTTGAFALLGVGGTALAVGRRRH